MAYIVALHLPMTDSSVKCNGATWTTKQAKDEAESLQHNTTHRLWCKFAVKQQRGEASGPKRMGPGSPRLLVVLLWWHLYEVCAVGRGDGQRIVVCLPNTREPLKKAETK